MKKRAEGGDAIATHQLGSYYRFGSMGLPQDLGKAMELWLQAGKRGSAAAYYNIAIAYYNGQGVGPKGHEESPTLL